MEAPAVLDYEHAYLYVTAWAKLDHDDLTKLNSDGRNFSGTLGTLDFQFSSGQPMLHVWVFIMGGAGPFEDNRREIKSTLDKIAQQHPDQTSGGVFDIRTIPWNKQATPKLEPCLYLRLSITDGSLNAGQVAQQLKDFSRTGYIWHRERMLDVLQAYWKDHPKATK